MGDSHIAVTNSDGLENPFGDFYIEHYGFVLPLDVYGKEFRDEPGSGFPRIVRHQIQQHRFDFVRQMYSEPR